MTRKNKNVWIYITSLLISKWKLGVLQPLSGIHLLWAKRDTNCNIHTYIQTYCNCIFFGKAKDVFLLLIFIFSSLFFFSIHFFFFKIVYQEKRRTRRENDFVCMCVFCERKEKERKRKNGFESFSCELRRKSALLSRPNIFPFQGSPKRDWTNFMEFRNDYRRTLRLKNWQTFGRAPFSLDPDWLTFSINY